VLPTIILELDIGPRTLQLEQLADLDKIIEQAIHEKQPNPYWAYLWPSARALACQIGEGESLDNLRTLDLGCGLGALGISAAARGAQVICADITPDALELAARNAAKNNVTIETRLVDWNAPPADLGQFDRIYAADVLYEDGMLAAVVRFLKTHLHPEGRALIADPLRIEATGIAGAARFHGIEVSSVVLEPGATMTGGVALHELRHHPRRR
jgi:2-polyprenyl-3-methyl-5-hydroxy-6-metoxy-1,4-benzoquinol methylase